MESLGTGEVLVILLMVLVVVGPERLPQTARTLGRNIAKARRALSELSGGINSTVDDPAIAQLREIGEFAVRPKQKLNEFIREAEAELERQEAGLHHSAPEATADEPEAMKPVSPGGPRGLEIGTKPPSAAAVPDAGEAPPASTPDTDDEAPTDTDDARGGPA